MKMFPSAHVPDGKGRSLTYAVGDIHGRADLLKPLLDFIRRDRARRGTEPANVVFLGDYVDRGVHSRQVLDLLIAFDAEAGFSCRFLLGNHEDAMLDYLAGNSSGQGWSRHGGDSTLRSYGIPRPANDTREGWGALRSDFVAALPSDHRAFLDRLELMVRIDDMLFVHAGIRQGVAIADQSKRDLLWIRREFLNAPPTAGSLVVHGHTPGETAYGGPGRLCLDSAAYVTGRLSGAIFHGSDVAIIEATASGVHAAPCAFALA